MQVTHLGRIRLFMRADSSVPSSVYKQECFSFSNLLLSLQEYFKAFLTNIMHISYMCICAYIYKRYMLRKKFEYFFLLHKRYLLILENTKNITN